MDPQAQRPVSFFAMVTDKRSAQKAKVGASMTSLQTPRIPGERSPRRPGDSEHLRGSRALGSTINSAFEQSLMNGPDPTWRLYH